MIHSAVILLVMTGILVIPVAAFTPDDLFEKLHVDFTSLGIEHTESGSWEIYEMVIEGESKIGDSIFVVRDFLVIFPVTDVVVLGSTDHPGSPQLSQITEIPGITLESAKYLSHFKFKKTFKVDGWSRPAVLIDGGKQNSFKVELFLYGLMQPVIHDGDNEGFMGRKRTWRGVVWALTTN